MPSATFAERLTFLLAIQRVSEGKVSCRFALADASGYHLQLIVRLSTHRDLILHWFKQCALFPAFEKCLGETARSLQSESLSKNSLTSRETSQHSQAFTVSSGFTNDLGNLRVLAMALKVNKESVVPVPLPTGPLVDVRQVD